MKLAPVPRVDPIEALLRELIDVTRETLDVERQILVAVQQPQQRTIAPLSVGDRVVLAKMLPAVRGVYGPETFTARDLVEDDRAAVRIVMQERSVKQVGKLLARAAGIAIDGLMLQRQGLEFQVTTWRLVAV